MSDWPDGRTSDRRDRYGSGSGSAEPEGARAMPQVRRAGQGVGGAPRHAEPPLPPD
ncbi:LytR family transcriptional regulator, partial [Streptomyces sp. 2MCAF27]